MDDELEGLVGVPSLTMKTILRLALSGLFACFIMVGLVPTPAQAAPPVALGTGCTAGVLCGSIYNVGAAGPGGTGEAIYVSRDRGTAQDIPIGPYAWVHAGQSSKSLWPDTDAWYLPPGRDAKCGEYTAYGWQSGGTRTATGWYKIRDGEGLKCWIVN